MKKNFENIDVKKYWCFPNIAQWMFDVDTLPRRGKHHLAMWQMFSEQPNVIHQLSVLQREFTYNTFRCRCTWFIQQPGNRVYSLPRRMQNNALRCACHVAYDTCRYDIVICDIILRRSTRSYLNMFVFIQSDIIAYRISDVACSMLHWCKMPLTLLHPFIFSVQNKK